MDERTPGLILRTRLLTETSLIVHWLTPDFGRLATVAKGARRPKSPFRGKLDLFFLCDFSFRRSRRSELHTLCEVVARDTHARLREDLGWLEQASYCVALLEQTTETETPLPWAFDLVLGLIRQLPTQPPQAQTVFACEAKLLSALGLQPDPAKTRLTAGSQEILGLLFKQDWPAIARLRLSSGQVEELGQFLHGFLIYQFDRLPSGRGTAIKQ